MINPTINEKTVYCLEKEIGHLSSLGPKICEQIPQLLKDETGAKFEFEVQDVKLKSSPLEHGGVEIQMKLFAWDSYEKLLILVDKIKVIKYLITESIF